MSDHLSASRQSWWTGSSPEVLLACAWVVAWCFVTLVVSLPDALQDSEPLAIFWSVFFALLGILVIAMTAWSLRGSGSVRTTFAPWALLGLTSAFYSVSTAIGLLDIIMFVMSFVIFAPAIILTGIAAKAGFKVVSGALVFGPLFAASLLAVVGSLIDS